MFECLVLKIAVGVVESDFFLKKKSSCDFWLKIRTGFLTIPVNVLLPFFCYTSTWSGILSMIIIKMQLSVNSKKH